MSEWDERAKSEYGVSSLDLERLKCFEEYDEDSSGSLLLSVIELYLESSPSLLKSLKGAVERGDLTATQKFAHNLKSSTSNIGAVELTELLQAIEEATYPETPVREIVRNCLSRAEVEFSRVCKELGTIKFLIKG